MKKVNIIIGVSLVLWFVVFLSTATVTAFQSPVLPSPIKPFAPEATLISKDGGNGGNAPAPAPVATPQLIVLPESGGENLEEAKNDLIGVSMVAVILFGGLWFIRRVFKI